MHLRSARVVPSVALLLACALGSACGGDDDGPGAKDGDAATEDGGMDAAADSGDASTGEDASPDATDRDARTPADDAETPDATPDAEDDADPDAAGDADPDAPPDAVVDPGTCNEETGIECDGDWTGRCTPACDVGECCSPQRGEFTCVPPREDGRCPAADLWVDAERIVDAYEVEWDFFRADDCALVEGCVEASGSRRLLRFDTWTPNTGDADMFLGDPDESLDYFEYSACHDHHHFNTYAVYELLAPDGTIAARGHKQAFCLLDYYRYPGEDGRGDVYDCGFQGIQRGWQDVYSRNLDCQWVDVTEIAGGDYVLRISINTEHLLNETDYSNNVVEIPVTIPPVEPEVDVTVPCEDVTRGTTRACGLVRDAVRTCTPGEELTVACSAACEIGACTGDPFIRVCDGDRNCGLRYQIDSNDDSGCGGGRCGRGGDCCPAARFACPESGLYTVLWAPYQTDEEATCTVSVTAVAPETDGGLPKADGDAGPDAGP